MSTISASSPISYLLLGLVAVEEDYTSLNQARHMLSTSDTSDIFTVQTILTVDAQQRPQQNTKKIKVGVDLH